MYSFDSLNHLSSSSAQQSNNNSIDTPNALFKFNNSNTNSHLPFNINHSLLHSPININNMTEISGAPRIDTTAICTGQLLHQTHNTHHFNNISQNLMRFGLVFYPKQLFFVVF